MERGGNLRPSFSFFGPDFVFVQKKGKGRNGEDVGLSNFGRDLRNIEESTEIFRDQKWSNRVCGEYAINQSHFIQFSGKGSGFLSIEYHKEHWKYLFKLSSGRTKKGLTAEQKSSLTLKNRSSRALPKIRAKYSNQIFAFRIRSKSVESILLHSCCCLFLRNLFKKTKTFFLSLRTNLRGNQNSFPGFFFFPRETFFFFFVFLPPRPPPPHYLLWSKVWVVIEWIVEREEGGPRPETGSDHQPPRRPNRFLAARSRRSRRPRQNTERGTEQKKKFGRNLHASAKKC